MNTTRGTTDGPRVFAYHGGLPLLVALLCVAPVLVIFLSLAAVLAGGGMLAAFVLPLFFRARPRKRPEPDCVELDPDDYTRVDREPRRLPPR